MPPDADTSGTTMFAAIAGKGRDALSAYASNLWDIKSSGHCLILLGNAIGRTGREGEVWATATIPVRNRLQRRFRHMEVDHAFLEGGHINDFGMKAEAMLSPQSSFVASAQSERRAFPLLASQPKSNITSSVQLTFVPHRRVN